MGMIATPSSIRIITLLFLSYTCPFALGAIPNQRAEHSSKRVRALIVADSGDQGRRVAREMDGQGMKSLLEAALGRSFCETKYLSGAKAKPECITAYLAALPADLSHETLVCYMSCPGGYDFARGHYFTLAGQRIWRAELLERMAAKKPQLIVLLSDCYSALVSMPQAKLMALLRSAPPEDSHSQQGRHQPPESQLMADLFLRSDGIVDLTTAGNQPAFADPIHGGYFTQAFIRACSYEFSETPDQLSVPQKEDELDRQANPRLYDDRPLDTPSSRPRITVESPRLWQHLSGLRGLKIDKNQDGFISWAEFLAFNCIPHLQILCSSRLETPLDPEPGLDHVSPQASDSITKLYGWASIRIAKTRNSWETSREYLICPSERQIDAYVRNIPSVPQGLRIARGDAHAKMLLKRELQMQGLGYIQPQDITAYQFDKHPFSPDPSKWIREGNAP
jgi:hypothetical protein